MGTDARDRLGTSLVIAAVASVGAGIVHAAAAGTHSDDPALAWTFAACAVLQIGWAGIVVTWPRPVTVLGGVLINAACAGAWVLSRTTGLAGPLAGVEPVGIQDAIAALLGAVAMGGALVALPGVRAGVRAGGDRTGGRRIDLPVVVLATIAVTILAVPAAAAPHDHGDDHTHGTTIAAAAAHDHTHADAGSTSVVAHDHSTAGSPRGSSDATGVTGPIVSLTDARLTDAERARAASLLTRTRDALRAYPDEASVVADGYTWIGDGRRPGGFQHFVKSEYLGDGRMLDPGHIETIVLQVQPDGITKVVASAMYIAEHGTTMETVPDIAGELTVWHDHQNLCWNGNQVAGLLVNGVCVPGGTFRPTAPMIHVWVDDPPCGPFSGIEGHGGGSCEHTHAS